MFLLEVLNDLVRRSPMDIGMDSGSADATQRRIIKAMSPHRLAKVGARAINRATKSARAEGSREIRKDLVLKARDVKEKMKITKARPTKLEGRITMSKSPIPLSMFKPGQRKHGVSVRILKSKGRGIIKGSFIIEAYGGEVFVRRYGADGKMNKRGPLKMLQGPSIASHGKRAKPAMDAKAEEMMEKRMTHEIDRLFRKAE